MICFFGDATQRIFALRTQNAIDAETTSKLSWLKKHFTFVLVYPSIILRGNKQLNFVEGKKSKSCVEKKVFTTFTPNLSFPTFILHYPKKGKEGDISAQVEVNELCPIPFFSAGGATFLTNCFVILLEGLLL